MLHYTLCPSSLSHSGKMLSSLVAILAFAAGLAAAQDGANCTQIDLRIHCYLTGPQSGTYTFPVGVEEFTVHQVKELNLSRPQAGNMAHVAKCATDDRRKRRQVLLCLARRRSHR